MIPSILLLLALVGTGSCYPAADEVKSLPGWSAPLLSRVFSGFIPAGSEQQNGITYEFHYWYMFIEAEVDDPSAAPIVLWTNGGPGASSAYGLFAELGPYQLSDQSLLTEEYKTTGVPTLFRNTYAWTKLANVLILNGGGPVGFTYCLPAGPSGGADRCGEWNDDITATHNKIFVENWFQAFPEYAENELFIVAESYGGVYGPMLFQQLLHSNEHHHSHTHNKHSSKTNNNHHDHRHNHHHNHNDEKPLPPSSSSSSSSSSSPKLNLIGLALGDACVGTDILCGARTGPWFSLLFLGGHGCISMPTFTGILEECDHNALKTGDLSNITPLCKELLTLSSIECPSGSYYEYNYYDKCQQPAFLDMGVGSPAQPNGFPCGGDTALSIWITDARVKESLNVPANAYYFSADNGEGFIYNSTYKNALPFLYELAHDGIHRVMIYNGDSDPGLSSFRAQNWTSSSAMNMSVSQPWRAWTLDGAQRTGGAVVTYEGQFQFVQIKGSGHMVPMYAPEQAYVMLQHWLQNKPLPSFVPPPSPSFSLSSKRHNRRPNF